MRFGISLFGFNPILMKDPDTVLPRLKKAGFRYLEPCVSMIDFPEHLRSHVWELGDLTARKPFMDKYGFTVDSFHLFTKDLAADIENVIPVMKAAGVTKLIYPCPHRDTAAEYDALIPMLNAAGAKLRENGLSLLIHNGDDVELQHIDGISAFEYVLRAVSPDVKAQADTGWLMAGGDDPEAFLWKYKDKIGSIHHKEMKRGEKGWELTPMGTGENDIAGVFDFARANELIQLVDQDYSNGDFIKEMEDAGGILQSLCGARRNTSSTLCVIDTVTGEVTELNTYKDTVIEAPNWSQYDDDILYYNCNGTIRRYSISKKEETMIPSGKCANCNNDHVLSADGKYIAVSHSDEGWMSQVYILPVDGGEPRLVTPNKPSFLHGWSPDGKELAYCAFRDHGHGTEVDVYAIPAEGGEETRLTHDAGFNDGPEYSPDGAHIWFISTRTGLMQCWRMNRDGSGQTQMTFTQRNNWFPHVSPDGKKVIYLSYSKDGLDASQHLPNMHVELRIMNSDGSGDAELLSLFGGQGTINVNSWSKDSRRAAFVKYTLDHK